MKQRSENFTIIKNMFIIVGGFAAVLIIGMIAIPIIDEAIGACFPEQAQKREEQELFEQELYYRAVKQFEDSETVQGLLDELEEQGKINPENIDIEEAFKHMNELGVTDKMH